MKSWWLVAGLFLSLGINIGLVASYITRPDISAASPSTPDVSRPPGIEASDGVPPPERLALMAERRLGLEGADRDRFVNRQLEFFERNRRLRRELEEARRELRRALVQDRPEPERIEALVERSSRLHGELELAFARHVIEVREMLPDETEEAYLRFLAQVNGRLGGVGRPGARPGRPPARRGAPPG